VIDTSTTVRLARRPVRVIVTLELLGDPASAQHVVDAVLDAGVFQDAINDHDCDAKPLRVLAASARVEPTEPPIATGTVREFTAADADCPTDAIGQTAPGWYYWTGARWDGQADSRAQAEHYARIGAITR
jgi:hypothetical protein